MLNMSHYSHQKTIDRIIFIPLTAPSGVPIDPIFGATEITKPGKDMGAYQLDGTGCKH